jgi:2-keto-4-pentenoate hydratase/2-oxohepta-3-ene-1,7-dioic acid hydratase in catechol pathway
MKIICIGRNYAAHASELKNEIPSAPVVFLKPQTAYLATGAPFYYPPFTKDLHYECEIVLRVGKSGKFIEPKFAHKYINGYTLGIDFTARDLQDQQKAKGLPWEIAKAFDHSAVVGTTFIDLTAENFEQPLAFQFYRNNNLVQEGDTSLLLFPFSTIIAYVSQFFSLQTGDLIFTGTPAGVGPIEIGDHLEGRIGDVSLLSCFIK